MPSTERSRSCTMARKGRSRRSKARNGCVGGRERLKEKECRGHLFGFEGIFTTVTRRSLGAYMAEALEQVPNWEGYSNK